MVALLMGGVAVATAPEKTETQLAIEAGEKELAEMPGAQVGPDGEVVVHANDRRASVAGLGEEFAAPHRAHRITDLLGERPTWDTAGLAEIQTDTRLGSWPTFQTLLGGVAATGPAEELRQRLLAWDGHMDADSHDAARFAAWRTELVLAVAAHPRLTLIEATTVEEVIAEIAVTRMTERGATRGDDKVSDAAMEDRKKEGYF